MVSLRQCKGKGNGMTEKQRFITEFEKNSLEKVKIHLQQWKNQNYIDVRVFYLDEEKTENPTKKGICLKVELLPQFTQALQQAEAVIEKRLPSVKDAGDAPDEAVNSGPPREEDGEENADG